MDGVNNKLEDNQHEPARMSWTSEDSPFFFVDAPEPMTAGAASGAMSERANQPLPSRNAASAFTFTTKTH